MCLRKTNASERIRRLCIQSRFHQSIVLKKSKRILDQYRDARSVEIVKAADEEERLVKIKQLIRSKYEQTYFEKRGHETGSLDYLVMEVLGTSWTDHLIETVYSKIDELQINEEDYKSILNMYYFGEKEYEDDFIMDHMGLGRSTYYRRKKEATILFGLLLWSTMIEECTDLKQSAV